MDLSSSQILLNYHVFLSFRGKDARKTIVSHLYKALVEKGILTFKDDRELERGESIPDEIRRAIRTSRFALVVISENYASSTWCLDELLMIMRLHLDGELIVVPIFYGVEPSDVRHQQGRFDNSFQRYKGPEMAEKVLKWRQALSQVANLSGVDSSTCADEATMIEEIVGDISSRLPSMQPTDFSNIVGMEAHMEQIRPLLDIGSGNEVRVVGLWGMGGVGKTTVAKCLFERFSRPFSPHYCFIENVRSVCKQHGLLYSQEQFLSNILREKHMKLGSVERASQHIKARLEHRKVFVVLDGVDNVNQLRALAKETTWFGPGSRIIITTRDRGLLKSCGVGTVYEVKCLDKNDAHRMFKQLVFEGACPPPYHLEQLSTQASSLAQGLPSAIEALGLYLRGKTKLKEWEEVLHRFEKALHKDVQDVLMISYDELDEADQTVFLHVACLFNGDHVSRVITLLDDGESEVDLGITVLAEKSLIDLSIDGRITMHALLQRMGTRIACRDSTRNPSGQRFLLNTRDICKVLAASAGTRQIGCISLHMCDMHYTLSMGEAVFEPMCNLRFLKFYKHSDDAESKLQLTSNEYALPNELRLLHWDAYPSTSLPSIFHLQCLVELYLRYSHLESLWNGKPGLGKLRMLDLTGSKNLRQLPDLSGATKLEELRLKGCTRLRQIQDCISGLFGLMKLDLSLGDDLVGVVFKVDESMTPQERGRRPSRHITLEFPNVTQKLRSLTHISIEGKINIQLRPYLEGDAENFFLSSEQQTTFGSMTWKHQAARSHIQEFRGLISLGIMRFNYSDVRESFRCYSLSIFPGLTELNLVNLNIKKIPDDIDQLTFLEKVDLSGNDFESLPVNMKNLTKLEHVRLCDCCHLQALPQLTQLKTLTLSQCKNLLSLPHCSNEGEEDRKEYYRLLELGINSCKNIQSLSDQLSHFANLTQLDLTGHEIEILPTIVRDLSSLITLCLDCCHKLRSIEELPLSLNFLYAHGCESLETVYLSPNHSVKRLDLSRCFSLKQHEYLITRFITQNEVSELFSCLPGCKIPSHFIYQTTKSSISISLTRDNSAAKFVGIDVCIVIASRRTFMCSSSSYYLKWQDPTSFTLKVRPDFLQTPEGTESIEEEDAESDHMFIFRLPSCIYEYVYQFEFRIHLEYSHQEFPSPPGKIKLYGVRLIFEDDLKDDVNVEYNLEKKDDEPLYEKCHA